MLRGIEGANTERSNSGLVRPFSAATAGFHSTVTSLAQLAWAAERHVRSLCDISIHPTSSLPNPSG
jgi:hypothetical protein